jgi:hypothetical protein
MRRTAIICGLVAVLAGGTAVGVTISAYDWNPSILVRMAGYEKIAPAAQQADPDFVMAGLGHFDGVYFYTIARDPLALNDLHTTSDLGAFRYIHPVYGWLGWMFSLGQPSLLPWALLLINLVLVGIAAFLASKVAVELGRTPWAGLIVALNPGLIYATTVDTAEPLAVAVLAGVVLLWLRRKYKASALLMIVLCLVREYFLLVPIGLLIWEWVCNRRNDTDKMAGPDLIWVIAGPAAFIGWYFWIWSRFHTPPFSQGSGVVSRPFWGWIDTFNRAVDLSTAGEDGNQIGTAALPILVSIFIILIIGLLIARHLRTFIDVVYILLAILILSLGWQPLLFPKDMIRTLVVIGCLWPAVIASMPRGSPRPVAETGQT